MQDFRRQESAEARNLRLNTSLYLQEDTSPSHSRLRTTQVSFILFRVFLFTSVCISALQCLAVSHTRETRLCVICCVVFCLFQVPLISCASPWRAGETRNGASPKYCHYYVTELSL